MPSTLLNVLRGALLVISLAAAVTALVWRYRPAWVERVDAAVLDQRFGEAQRLHAEMQSALAAGGPAAAEDPARRLAAATRGMRRRDRFDELRQEALTTLIDAAEERGAGTQELLDLRNTLHEFHPRVLLNEYARARLLGKLGRTEEADEVMALTLAVGGHLPELQRQRLEDLARDGDALGLVSAVEAMGFHGGPFAPRPDARFELRVAGPVGGWSPPHAATLERGLEPGQFLLATDVTPGPLARLRLDLPPNLPMRVRVRSLGTDAGTFEAAEIAASGAHQLEVTSPLTFEASGGNDPYVSLLLPRPTDARRIEIAVDAALPAPPEVVAFTGSPAGRALVTEALAGRPGWVRTALGVTP